MANLQKQSNSLISEIQQKETELGVFVQKLIDRSEEDIKALRKEIQAKSDSVINEFREKTLAKAETDVSSKAVSGIMETFSEEKKETESNNTEENV